MSRVAIRGRCCALVVLTLAWATLAPLMARADTPRVAIVSRASQSALVEQIVGELGFLGFETVTVRPSARSSEPSALARLARERKATSALFIDAEAHRLRLWFESSDPSESGDPSSVIAGRDDRDLALRAAEMVRARYAVREAAAVFDDHLRWPRFGLRVSSGPTISAGGLSTMAHLWVGVGYRPWRWLELETFFAGPLYPGQVTAPEGRGKVFAGLVGFGPLIQLLPRPRRVELFIGAGLAFSLVHMQGDPVEPLSRQSDWLPSGVGYGRVALAVRLTNQLRLRAEGITGVAVPRPIVTFNGRQVAAWGRPLIAISAGVEVTP
jgi:hypothetical protein